MKLTRFFKRLFKWYAKPPVPPPDCLVVLTVFQNRITGWTKPDFVTEVTFKRGVSFVFLTQHMIDCFIPPHTPEEE